MFSLFQKDATNSIHVNEIEEIIKDINLIDIREPYEYERTRIRSSKNIPMSQLLMNPSKYLDKSKKYYIICQSGGRSSGTVSSLHKAGYDVVNVRGGVGSYSGKL